ncbi:MAG: hypothetical protein AUK48_06475 [Oscillatoriales cyanobacterium CG2_30_44_21]|nr:MAG: hypothetical protein AUK48_06475 [Oscillatoriales cyanobacterium CG2_30_44_21]
MLPTQTSLQSRFRAIWTSLLLSIPTDFTDRLEELTKIVFTDSLNNLQLADDLETTVVAIAIGAYWHQDLQQVRTRLLDLQSQSHIDIQEMVLAYAIALAYRHELKPKSFISQICYDFEKRRSLSADPQFQAECLAKLRSTQKYVDQGISTITAHQGKQSLSGGIYSSLYYFLSTPHSWQIVSERAHQHHRLTRFAEPENHQAHTQVLMQAGAIAAAYLGELGNTDKFFYAILTRGEQLGDRLWREWAGVFDVKLDN